MMTLSSNEGAKGAVRKYVLPALAALFWTGMAGAQQTINKTNITQVSTLAAFFDSANANPANTYNLYLAWVKDAYGNTLPFVPPSTLTLTKGKVNLYGSNTHLYPEKYIFDGQGQRLLFRVDGSTGYKPTLTLTGITVQNGLGPARGGGLSAYKADDIEIFYCRFLNNKSFQNGSGVDIQETRNFYMLHCLVDRNLNTQWGLTIDSDPNNGQCSGGGLTGGGGGIAVEMQLGGTAQASIHHSTISNNRSCRGGGIEISGNVNVSMYQNTISGNKCTGPGGGILFRASQSGASSGTNYLRFNTIAYNVAGNPVQFSPEPRYGGGLGLKDYFGVFYYTQGNVVAKNSVRLPMSGWNYKGHDCYTYGGSPTASTTYSNVVGKIDNCDWLLGSYGSWAGVGSESYPVDPYLQPLAVGSTNDGFALPVHVPYSYSIALAGFVATDVYHQCFYDDQRGMRRPYGYSYCDIGSIEAGGVP
ncbi:MAG: right-handed parallel beta-helix repeat-containing protein [Fibrobacteres bacterium]|nr:right-handed parallel beta-helix repeat-containing protein [Fibrobacterota bacterium]